MVRFGLTASRQGGPDKLAPQTQTRNGCARRNHFFVLSFVSLVPLW